MPEELLGTDTSYLTGGDGSNIDFDGEMEFEGEVSEQMTFNQEILDESGNAIIIPDELASDQE